MAHFIAGAQVTNTVNNHRGRAHPLGSFTGKLHARIVTQTTIRGARTHGATSAPCNTESTVALHRVELERTRYRSAEANRLRSRQAETVVTGSQPVRGFDRFSAPVCTWSTGGPEPLHFAQRSSAGPRSWLDVLGSVSA